jgi:hypothetical protein
MLSHLDLGLPDGLASQFAEWLKRHDLHGRQAGFDMKTFDAMGIALARNLQELTGPSTKVHYRTIAAVSLLGRIRSVFRHRS